MASSAGESLVKAGPILAVIETHPIQYRAPVYRWLRENFQVPVTVIYGSDFSVTGYFDPEFRSTFAWDTDLLSGYDSQFLSTVARGAGRTYETVRTHGLGGALRKLNPAAVLLSGYSPRFHQWAWAHSLRLSRPILFRGETAVRGQTAATLPTRLRDGVLSYLYSRCSSLLYIGRYSREHFLAHGCPDEKLIFSPYCVDNSAFRTGEETRRELRQVTRAGLNIREDDLVLLFSGKLSERKGPDLIIDAVRAFAPECRKNYVIVFLGGGEQKTTLEAAANRDPGIRVHFTGFQNQTQMSRFYHAADLLVLPSRRHETWGLVVNEALDHGLPCVVSDAVGCAPDLVVPGITGEIFEAGSAAALSEAIRRARYLTGRVEVRDACRNRVSGYSVEKAAEGIALAWEAAIA